MLILQRLINGAAMESGQWLENVDQAHQVLAKGKQVLQKRVQDLEGVNGVHNEACAIPLCLMHIGSFEEQQWAVT